jgi:hypothetical protein
LAEPDGSQALAFLELASPVGRGNATTGNPNIGLASDQDLPDITNVELRADRATWTASGVDGSGGLEIRP